MAKTFDKALDLVLNKLWREWFKNEIEKAPKLLAKIDPETNHLIERVSELSFKVGYLCCIRNQEKHPSPPEPID